MIKIKIITFVQNAVKNVSLETADNALIAMKNWSGIDNLKILKMKH